MISRRVENHSDVNSSREIIRRPEIRVLSEMPSPVLGGRLHLKLPELPLKESSRAFDRLSERTRQRKEVIGALSLKWGFLWGSHSYLQVLPKQ
jgi:hypothetical protein